MVRPLLVLVTFSLFVVGGSDSSRPNPPRDGTASCGYDTPGTVECYYLRTQDDMALLEWQLEDKGTSWHSFGLRIYYSDGPAIPLNMFRGYNITDLLLYNCDFPKMPYDLLMNMEPALSTFQIMYNTFASTELTAPPILMPFSETLNGLEISMTNIKNFDESLFAQFKNLGFLHLYGTFAEYVGLQLLNLNSLTALELLNNKISYIETGAFRDLQNLVTLYLENNNFSTLQEGAFLGLETSPIVIIDLSSNPWYCTCELQWLKSWLEVRGLAESSGATCAYPPNATFTGADFC